MRKDILKTILNKRFSGKVSHNLSVGLHRTAVAIFAVGTVLLISATNEGHCNSQQLNLQSRNASDVIYGDDDRRDMYQIQDENWRRIARSTVALFRNNNVTVQGEWAHLLTQKLGYRLGLCEDEPFYNQGSGAFCSGTLIGPDLVLTAGHCITSQGSCYGTSLVFDFAVWSQQNEGINAVPASSVYRCTHLVQHRLEQSGEDWAIVRLDRAVTDRHPLAINRTEPMVNGTNLVLIGHPSGIPTKIAGGAWVRDDSNPYFVQANTDSYGGNSGSGVFNANTGMLEGVLVRGHNDYETDPARGCTRSVRCENDGCNGEDITRVTAAAAHIPLLPAPGVTPGFPGVDPGFGGGAPQQPSHPGYLWPWPGSGSPGFEPSPGFGSPGGGAPGYGWLP